MGCHLGSLPYGVREEDGLPGSHQAASQMSKSYGACLGYLLCCQFCVSVKTALSYPSSSLLSCLLNFSPVEILKVLCLLCYGDGVPQIKDHGLILGDSNKHFSARERRIFLTLNCGKETVPVERTKRAIGHACRTFVFHNSVACWLLCIGSTGI